MNPRPLFFVDNDHDDAIHHFRHQRPLLPLVALGLLAAITMVRRGVDEHRHHLDNLLTTKDFEQLGLEILCKQIRRTRRPLYRKYESFFGAWPHYCAILWNALLRSRVFDTAPASRVQPRHLLMGLHFLKAYGTEERSAHTFGCDEKTFRRWAWYILGAIAQLESEFVRCEFFHLVR
jgi:hypothetical protein